MVNLLIEYLMSSLAVEFLVVVCKALATVNSSLVPNEEENGSVIFVQSDIVSKRTLYTTTSFDQILILFLVLIDIF